MAGSFEESEFRIVLYRTIGEAKLVDIAATHGVPADERVFEIDRASEDGNEGLPGECWHANLSMKSKRDERRCPHRCSANHGWARSLVAIPVVVPRHEMCPWGVVYVLSKRRLDTRQCHDLAWLLNVWGGPVESLESLVEWQRDDTCHGLAW
ncbi:MAG: hypothetical protein JXQ73_11465 [Phycisphaerae bacterium]|nr:hypothetical protein [Phycisphaerae bacterium]